MIATHQPHKGFTLVELMITIAILAILTALVIPNFSILIQNNNLTTNTNQFVTALNFARSEAIKRGTPVTICHANPAFTDCDNTDNAWEDGWIIFTGGAVAQAGATINVVGPTIIRVQESLTGAGFQIRSKVPAPPITSNFVSYNGQGSAVDFVGANLASTFTMCDKRELPPVAAPWTNGGNVRLVSISLSGHVSSMPGDDPRNVGAAVPIVAC